MGQPEIILAEEPEFFAPAPTGMVDGLLAQYQAMRTKIDNVAALFDGELQRVVNYFIEGNRGGDGSRYSSLSAEKIFRAEGAIGALNADYWDRALKLTDVLNYMPQARKDKWYEQIRNPLGQPAPKLSQYDLDNGAVQKEWVLEPLPDFEEEVVRNTLASLLAMRQQFFGERVDGLFRALSRQHVTNCPQGFNKRMILQRAISDYGTIEWSTAGVINDLRCVIAKFMGREEPGHGATDAVVRAAKNRAGQWMLVDGGTLRIRVYAGVGTAHLEVHPEMAWRLNAVLASLYPAAIPAEFRTKPKRQRQIKDFQLFERPLPFAVISLLNSMKPGYRMRENPGFREDKFINIPRTRRFDHGAKDKAAVAEAERVLAALGGVRDKEGNCEFWRFDYEPAEIIEEIVCSGCIPDQKSYQFYPTPPTVAAHVIELAEIEDNHDCLEPSAGTGSLASLMPLANTICVEISDLHCKVLQEKGYRAVKADFLEIAKEIRKRFDRVVMNPPFSEGRWQAHLAAAADLVKPGGRLVAVLPASARNKDLLGAGWACDWSQVFANEFAGTTVSVVILAANRIANAVSNV